MATATAATSATPPGCSLWLFLGLGFGRFFLFGCCLWTRQNFVFLVCGILCHRTSCRWRLFERLGLLKKRVQGGSCCLGQNVVGLGLFMLRSVVNDLRDRFRHIKKLGAFAGCSCDVCCNNEVGCRDGLKQQVLRLQKKLPTTNKKLLVKKTLR